MLFLLLYRDPAPSTFNVNRDWFFMGAFRRLSSIALDHVDLDKVSYRPVFNLRDLDVSPSRYGLVADEVQGMHVLDDGKSTGYIVLALES